MLTCHRPSFLPGRGLNSRCPRRRCATSRNPRSSKPAPEKPCAGYQSQGRVGINPNGGPTTNSGMLSWSRPPFSKMLPGSGNRYGVEICDIKERRRRLQAVPGAQAQLREVWCQRATSRPVSLSVVPERSYDVLVLRVRQLHMSLASGSGAFHVCLRQKRPGTRNGTQTSDRVEVVFGLLQKGQG